MQRKPGETLQALAARLRQDVPTCDFPSIIEPHDETLRQRFICFVNNEDDLKGFFKILDTERSRSLLWRKAWWEVAKETVSGSKTRYLNKVKQNQNKGQPKYLRQPNSTDLNISVTDVDRLLNWQNASTKTSNATIVTRKEIRKELFLRSNDSKGNIVSSLPWRESKRFSMILLCWLCLLDSLVTRPTLEVELSFFIAIRIANVSKTLMFAEINYS